MSLAKAVRKPYLAGSIICICFFLLELTAWPNMSPWSWLYLAPYCIALLLLTWFPVPASMAILVTHIACAIIPAICDGPSTLYGTWLVCGIVAFEIKRFEFAIMGPLLCALALPLGYWTGGIDYNPSIPVLACSYIGAFFVGFAIRWKIQTEQRKTDLAIAQEQVRRQQKSISPMTDELKTDKEEDADELFQQHIEAQCKRLRILGFTGTPIIRGNLNAMDKSLLPSLQTVCTEILNNIAKHGKPGAFAFILSVGPDAVRIFASNLYNAAINSAPENHYGTALIQDFAQQHNGTMTINSENEEWSLSLAIPLTHQTH